MEKSEYSKVNWPDLREFKKLKEKDRANFYIDAVYSLMENNNNHYAKYNMFIHDIFTIKPKNYYIDTKELSDFLCSIPIKNNIIDELNYYFDSKVSINNSIGIVNNNGGIEQDGVKELSGIIHSKSLSYSIIFIVNYFVNSKIYLKISAYYNQTFFEISAPPINEKINSDEGKILKLILNLIFYMSAFPEKILDRPPDEVCDKLNKNNSKTISLSKEIADYIHENRDVSPHLRRGHFRMLSSDYFKNKQGQIVFVKSSFVKGNAKTVIE